MAVSAIIYLSPKASAAATPEALKPALTVSTALPVQQDLPLKLSANGSIAAWQEAIIGSESNGLRLQQVLVNVGDRVKAGQLLAVFSTDSTEADTAQARASLLEAQATALEAADTAARARTLDQSGALSAQQIHQYNTAEQTARARVEAAQAMLQAQQLRGRQTRVLAPDSGVISARSATVGAVVGAGTELFRMIRGGRLEWRAEVTSAELGRLRVGTPVTVMAANGAPLAGRVRMVAPTVDPQTRAALVYVDLPPMPQTGGPALAAGSAEMTTSSAGSSPHPPAGAAEPASPGRRRSAPSGGSEPHAVGSVGAANEAPGRPKRSSAPSGGSEPHAVGSVGATLPGMFAKGDFELGSTPALTVPQSALVVRDGFNYVFALNPDQRISQLKVQTGRLSGDRVEITAGLEAGRRVVVSGAGFLNDGDLVRVNDATATQP